MMLRFLQQYRTALVSFCFGLMVMASVGATSFLWIANAESITSFGGKSTGCPANFSCQRQTVGMINKIIPQCEVAGYPDIDAARCCNYTLDAFIQLAINIAQLILGMSGSVALIMVMYGGFQYLTSSGDAAKVKAGTGTLFNAGIGLLIIFSSWLIVNFIMASLIATPTGETAPVNISGGETLNQKLRAIFKNTTSGKTQWEYNASICRNIDFGTVGSVDPLSGPDTPGSGTNGANGVLTDVNQTAQNKTGAGCYDYCSYKIDGVAVARVSDPSVNLSFVKSWGSLTPANGSYLGVAQLKTLKGNTTETKLCTCSSYTELTNVSSGELAPSQNQCGTKIAIGSQNIYGFKCSSASDGIYEDFPDFKNAYGSYTQGFLQTLINNTYDDSWRGYVSTGQNPSCHTQGTTNNVGKFTLASGTRPQCDIVGYCCVNTDTTVDHMKVDRNGDIVVGSTDSSTTYKPAVAPTGAVTSFGSQGSGVYNDCAGFSRSSYVPKAPAQTTSADGMTVTTIRNSVHFNSLPCGASGGLDTKVTSP